MVPGLPVNGQQRARPDPGFRSHSVPSRGRDSIASHPGVGLGPRPCLLIWLETGTMTGVAGGSAQANRRRPSRVRGGCTGEPTGNRTKNRWRRSGRQSDPGGRSSCGRWAAQGMDVAPAVPGWHTGNASATPLERVRRIREVNTWRSGFMADLPGGRKIRNGPPSPRAGCFLETRQSRVNAEWRRPMGHRQQLPPRSACVIPESGWPGSKRATRFALGGRAGWCSRLDRRTRTRLLRAVVRQRGVGCRDDRASRRPAGRVALANGPHI